MTDNYEEIKQAITVSSVAREHTVLRSTGTSKFSGRCPLHQEKTPSFVVDDSRGTWRCWGCGQHGDVIDLYKKLNCLSLPDAVSELKRQAGIEDTFLTKSQKLIVDKEKKKRLLTLKSFHNWKNKLILELIAYTNAQWAIYRIASRQAMKSSTIELETQIDFSRNEAIKREKALDDLESMPDKELMEWYETKKTWEGIRNPLWVLSGWRKTMAANTSK